MAQALTAAGATARARGERARALLFALALGPVAALALGLTLVGRRSLTVDEAAALEAAGRPLADVVENDPAQAAYVALLSGVASLDGSEWAARLPSVAAAVVAAAATAWLGTRLLGRLGGAVSGLALALNAAVVAASREARPYALAVAAVALATALLTRAVDGGAGWWALYALAALGLVLAHPLAASVLAAHAATVYACRRRVRLAYALPALGLVTAESALLLAAGALDRVDEADGTGGLQAGELGRGVLESAGGNPLLLGLAAAGVGLLALGWSHRDEQWAAVLLGGTILAPPAAVLAAGTVLPVYPEQALVLAAPGVAVAAARALLWIPVREGLVAGVLVTGVISAGLTVDRVAGEPAEDWRSAARAVAIRYREGDTVVVVPPRARAAFARYAPEVPTVLRGRGRAVWIVVHADDGADATALARASIRTPRYALLAQARHGAEVIVQRWVRP